MTTGMEISNTVSSTTKEYTYSKDQLGLSDEEFRDYVAELSVLNDIWNYESSIGEKESVFNSHQHNHCPNIIGGLA